MIRLSIKRKIIGIAVVLIVLMTITAFVSMALVMEVGHRLEDLTQSYVPAYGDLARANIRSLDRALFLRRMVIERFESLGKDGRYGDLRARFDASGQEFHKEMNATITLLNGLINKGTQFGDATALVRLQTRLTDLIADTRDHLDDEIARLLPLLDAGDQKSVADSLDRIDALRDELDRQLDSVRTEMLDLLRSDTAATTRKQQAVTLTAILLTAFAAALGLIFSILVSSGLTRPVRQLLEGTRAVEAGHLDQNLAVTSKDEIGLLTMAFNRMVEQLRAKERIRETFGKYIDPRIVESLISGPAPASEGQRRVMTVLFCDIRGFAGVSEEMTPQGLVKVMNRYFSTMSAPIRAHDGIIDKYIGDAIMAYWGPPFAPDADQARLASLAALEMLERVEPFQAELSDLLGLKSVPIALDIRIGIATGEVLVGSIGSELMMSYTVMGDTVNLASRLEGANKLYGGHILLSQATAEAAADAFELREIDRVVLLGQTQPQVIYEIMGRKGALGSTLLELRTRYAEGLAAYRWRHWDEARQAFMAALNAVPGDGPSLALLKRVDLLATAAPPDDWDGAWHLDQK